MSSGASFLGKMKCEMDKCELFLTSRASTGETVGHRERRRYVCEEEDEIIRFYHTLHCSL